MHKSGDIREDGYIFSQYSKQANGKVYEIWLSPEARERDLQRRRDRIANKRKDVAFLQKERTKRNELRRLKYQTDSEYRARMIRSAIETERRKKDDPVFKIKRSSARVRRYSERYKSDVSFASRCVEKAAARRERLKSDYSNLTKDSKEIIRCFYDLRARLSNCTGIIFHVDHVVPLARGGSHSPCNLQVITSIANMRKHARLEYVHNH